MTTITPPALTIAQTLCTCCDQPVAKDGRWSWLVGFGGKSARLCLDCARLDPVARKAKRTATKRAKRKTAVPDVWTKDTYHAYLKSAHWTRFKAEYSLREVKKCRVCGVYPPAQIDLHHNCYDHLGDERDHEVVWLCHDHHSMFHGKLPY